jgi:hypothetical protein
MVVLPFEVGQVSRQGAWRPARCVALAAGVDARTSRRKLKAVSVLTWAALPRVDLREGREVRVVSTA